MAGTFEIYHDQQGAYSFRLKSRTGDVVATGLSFPTRDAAKRGIAAVLFAAAGATIAPETAGAPVRLCPPV
jgi:uncharacterized protein YegP (UPF0339 family)